MSDVPTEQEYMQAFAEFVGTVQELGADVSHIVSDPASGGQTFALRHNAASTERIDATSEKLRTTEIPYVMSKLAEQAATRRALAVTAQQLQIDALLAAEQSHRYTNKCKSTTLHVRVRHCRPLELNSSAARPRDSAR